MRIPVLVLGAVAAGSMYGQGACLTSFDFGTRSSDTESTFRFSGVPIISDAITGAPYSARPTIQDVHIGADGSRQDQPLPEQPMVYRDSAGRMRVEARMMPVGSAGKMRPLALAQIDDAAAGYRIILDPVNRVAHRMAVCTVPAGSAGTFVLGMIGRPPGIMARPGASETRLEDLGSRTIFGVAAGGERRTSTYRPGTFPTGLNQKNDVTVVTVEELWTSVYGVLIPKGTTPPGEITTTLANFSTAEPDPALFQVPEGWKVVDETGPFSIAIRYEEK